MNNILGTVVTTMIVDKNERNLFAQKDGVTYKVLDQDINDFMVGDMIEGFVYIDQQGNHVMMTKIPKVQKGTYDWGEVVAVQRELGVFVDVGWLEKDLVVSMDDLPVFKNAWPRKGDHLLLSVSVDDKDRMWGKLVELDQVLENANAGDEQMHNDDLSGTVFSSLKAGSYVYLKDNLVGFIHPSEREVEPRLGELVAGRVIGVRDDGVLYLSLFPRAYEALDEDAAMIFEVLKRSPDNRIPYHDKSNPDEIRDYFGISKGQFKRAIGRLMKEHLVKQDAEGTFITEEGLKREL